ncbi:hypothetical protein USDA257_c52910 [Sinorhizobium fredii USDA 257]|uniref:Uncharacterized protein n=1 Tax=Sinorhizobium fredii (strain USDA 257) TaxID=1185652 RepID=I3XD59_SINF2|nr:hypothetical protein USDA257_c52910 [Sinorhizobium fredii USDA 257]
MRSFAKRNQVRASAIPEFAMRMSGLSSRVDPGFPREGQGMR